MAVTEQGRRLSVDARRAQLLQIGQELFSSHSYDDLSVGDIAEAAGLSKGLLYHYFSGKREFYVAVVAEFSRRLQEATAPDLSLPEGQRLLAALARYLDYVQTNAVGYVALIRGGLGADAEVADLVETSRAGFAARVLAQLPHGTDRREVQLLARGWVSMAEAVAIEWVLGDDSGQDRDAVIGLLAGSLTACLASVGITLDGAQAHNAG